MHARGHCTHVAPTWTVQVIKRANDTTYGLAAGVFTRDINKANSLARALKVGSLVNEFLNTLPCPALPCPLN